MRATIAAYRRAYSSMCAPVSSRLSSMTTRFASRSIVGENNFAIHLEQSLDVGTRMDADGAERCTRDRRDCGVIHGEQRHDWAQEMSGIDWSAAAGSTRVCPALHRGYKLAKSPDHEVARTGTCQ